MFHFAEFAVQSYDRTDLVYHQIGLPHSEISGSKVATHLPEAYRSYAASFIVILCQGIHRTPLICALKTGHSRLMLIWYLTCLFHACQHETCSINFYNFQKTVSRMKNRFTEAAGDLRHVERMRLAAAGVSGI